MTASEWGRRAGALLRDVVEAILLAVVLFFVLQLVVQNTVVEGSSMEPNFTDQEHLLVSKLAYRLGEPERGDVVVFHAPEGPQKDFIKRVIAVPGEEVELVDGVVHIDGERLDEPWRPLSDTSDFGPYVVPAGHLFVLGDNRAASNDSRVFGAPAGGLGEAAVPLDLVVGRAWLSVWPFESLGLVRSDAPGPGRTAALPR